MVRVNVEILVQAELVDVVLGLVLCEYEVFQVRTDVQALRMEWFQGVCTGTRIQMVEELLEVDSGYQGFSCSANVQLK